MQVWRGTACTHGWCPAWRSEAAPVVEVQNRRKVLSPEGIRRPKGLAPEGEHSLLQIAGREEEKEEEEKTPLEAEWGQPRRSP